MIIANPLLPFTFPFPSIFKEVPIADPEMDGPVKVTISSKKVYQTTRTVGGYAFSHWGDEPDQMRANGSVILLPGEEDLGFLSLMILKTLYRLDKKKIVNILGSLSKIGAVPAAAFLATAYGELAAQKASLGSNASTAQVVSQGVGIVMKTAAIGFTIQNMMQQMQQNPDLGVTYIYHDNQIYRGFFTSFDYTREAQNPRFINYNFTFIIDWSTENYFADQLIKSTSGSVITGLGL